MTILIHTEIECRNCGKASEQTVLASTHTRGFPDLDLRPSEAKRSTMKAWLQLCPQCGHCAPDITSPAADPAVLSSEAYREALHREDFPELARRFLAYAVANRSEPIAAANAFLRAAWVCDDAGRAEQAAESRQQAAEWFQRSKPFADDDQRLAVCAILVDVLRRCGRFAEASAECAALLGVGGATGDLRRVLEFQQRLIAQGETGAHVISEASQLA